MKIVLLGSIPKGDEIRQSWVDWKDRYIQVLKRYVSSAEFIHGDSISDNVGAEMVVGHDLYQIKQADICIVDACQKIGAGTAQEIVYAKYISKPVVAVIPKDTHHRKSNITFEGVTIEDWIHPFLDVTCDYIAETIEAAASWVKEYNQSPKKVMVKDISVLDEAVCTYEKQFAK